jgi:hypothetical protein
MSIIYLFTRLFEHMNLVWSAVLRYVLMKANSLSAGRQARPSSAAGEGRIIQALSFLDEYIAVKVQKCVGNIIHSRLFSRGDLLWISTTARYPDCSTSVPFHAIDVTVSSDFCQPCHTTLYPSHTCIINIEHLFLLSCISFV